MKFFAKRAVAQQLNALKERTAFKPKHVRRLLMIHEIDLDITEAQYQEMLHFFFRMNIHLLSGSITHQTKSF